MPITHEDVVTRRHLRSNLWGGRVPPDRRQYRGRYGLSGCQQAHDEERNPQEIGAADERPAAADRRARPYSLRHTGSIEQKIVARELRVRPFVCRSQRRQVRADDDRFARVARRARTLRVPAGGERSHPECQRRDRHRHPDLRARCAVPDNERKDCEGHDRGGGERRKAPSCSGFGLDTCRRRRRESGGDRRKKDSGNSEPHPLVAPQPTGAVGHRGSVRGTGRSRSSSFLPSPTLTTVRSPSRAVAGSRTHMTYLPGTSASSVGLLN